MSFSEHITKFLGWLFNLDDVRSIDHVQWSFAADWAKNMTWFGGARAWLWIGAFALTAVAVIFYWEHQRRGHRSLRIALSVVRALLLVVLLMILAEPIQTVTQTTSPKPVLYVLFDGTDSMNIQDQMSDAERAKLADALDIKTASPGASEANKLSRADYVRAVVTQPESEIDVPTTGTAVTSKKRKGNFLGRLEEQYRVRAFRFDQPDKGLSEVKLNDAAGKYDPEKAVGQLTADGQVTALGKALEDLATQYSTPNLGGVVIFSDFGQNAKDAPVGSEHSPVKELKVPVYTVGIGPKVAIDVGVELQAPLTMKKDQKYDITARLRQTGLDGERANVRLSWRRLNTAEGAPPEEYVPIGAKEVALSSTEVVAEPFPFKPPATGRIEFKVDVDPMPGETIDQNNHATREANVHDDFLRLMFVEYEPTWEWRFIKEVFHRDPLVGMRGFRTFLRSADPRVRQTNELFLPTMTPKRSDFFTNDVIFLGDMPSGTISPRFCELTKEFVDKFGGGLVVLAGPRFGPAQLADTPLADMLPVTVESGARPRDQTPFTLRLTSSASQFDFMRLSDSEAENTKAWNNMGQLPWYQPVSRVNPLATVLAEHPVDLCADGKTHQPLIAIRPYGKGEVIYIAFDETWRLRRKYGEEYYRQLWAQMIHRLGHSHVMGAHKRFVVQTDQKVYRVDDQVTLSVEAYDANFEPLTDDKLPDHKLTAELVIPGQNGGPGETRPIGIPPLQPADSSHKGAAVSPSGEDVAVSDAQAGKFETHFPVVTGGEHRLRVKDPITGDVSEVIFQVTNLSIERRSAVRNVALEKQIADANGGKSYDLENVGNLPDEIKLVPKLESSVKVSSLASTPFCFGLLLVLLLGEWLTRKLINLA